MIESENTGSGRKKNCYWFIINASRVKLFFHYEDTTENTSLWVQHYALFTTALGWIMVF